MKILLVNKFFFLNGGSEACLFDQAALLKERGHHVVFLSMDHPRNRSGDDPVYLVSHVDFSSAQGVRARVRAAARMIYSREARAVMEEVLAREQPDIALLHNIYHQLSPSILEPLARHGIPILMTLHDYKPVCPVYTLSTHGRPCQRCQHKAFHRCVVHRCCRGSFSASLLAAAEMTVHHRLLDLYDRVDTFLCPSRFLMEKVREMGFSKTLALLPNFIDARTIEPHSGGDDGSFVYFGRLTAEKGVGTLVAAMEGVPATCHIIGDGPHGEELRGEVRRRRLDNVLFTGHIPFSALVERVRTARAVVLPSEWYENSPRSVLEAFAMAKPVIGARIGGIPELVRDGVTGLLFQPGDVADLRRALLSSVTEAARVAGMGLAARKLVEDAYGPGTHYDAMMALCESARKRR